MRIRYWASLAIAALCLTGCNGFWKPLPSTGGGGGTTTLTSGDFYVLNVGTSQMVGLYVNAGTLTALPGSPYTLSATPIAITVAPNNAFLYVSTLGGIFVYTINTTTGQLTLGNNGQAITSGCRHSDAGRSYEFMADRRRGRRRRHFRNQDQPFDGSAGSGR